MSVALIPMASELGWSTAERGFVASAFFWGYAATQIPAGYIATRIGGAKVLLGGVILWSLGALSPNCFLFNFFLIFNSRLVFLCSFDLLFLLGWQTAVSAMTSASSRGAV